MRKLYENFHILRFQKRTVFVETIHRNMVLGELFFTDCPTPYVVTVEIHYLLLFREFQLVAYQQNQQKAKACLHNSADTT